MDLRFEFLSAKMTLLFLRVVTQCGLIGRYYYFGETYCLHLQVIVFPKPWFLSVTFLKMGTVCFSEALVCIYESTQRQNPEEEHRKIMELVILHPSCEQMFSESCSETSSLSIISLKTRD
jgi:hypothetical protein